MANTHHVPQKATRRILCAEKNYTDLRNRVLVGYFSVLAWGLLWIESKATCWSSAAQHAESLKVSSVLKPYVTPTVQSRWVNPLTGHSHPLIRIRRASSWEPQRRHPPSRSKTTHLDRSCMSTLP